MHDAVNHGRVPRRGTRHLMPASLLLALLLAALGTTGAAQSEAPGSSPSPLATAVPATGEPSSEPPPRPNIVVIYMDDFSPRAPELWSDAERTPTLARFVEEGIWLRAATGSTPRCCPARGNLLTGQWSHNNRLTENDAGAYRPRRNLGVKLRRAGYHTIWAGKFLNRLGFRVRTEEAMLPYARGWDDFDVIWANDGKFYDYRLWTRSGMERYRTAPRDHSTAVTTRKIRQHILEAPPDQPVFAVASLYNGHDPNLPMPRHERSRACRGVGPWTSPAVNEADVSDKPAYVQERPLLRSQRYRLTRRCKEVLSVEWSTRQIVRALRQSGRLEDSLLVFTADNGWLMREHRIDNKKAPYATPVPLYMLWPARWGSEPRTIDEPVSNVDLAPTFCALAGCSIPRADGLDLLPLLDGDVEALDRRFVYEESLHDKGTNPAFWGLRTTNAFDPARRWIYTEYSTGELELYDLAADPYQLENVAGDPAYAEVEAGLREMLYGEVIEPNEVRFRRD